ncbi:Vacuolar protein sorting-associated protein 20 [Bachmanniomyces sp. S44760]|nr:Vacuolar protein sorting-associated protein 20 [Bachmanniomyces sp. S44760]
MGQTPSSHKISAQDRAILDMKNQRDKLHQYQKRIVNITDRETAVAKECLSRGDKPRALLALRRKKYQETLLSKTDAQLESLQRLTSDVEFASVQKDVMFGLKQGTEVLRNIQKQMGGIEEVEKLMGESEDARAFQREVGEALAGGLSNEDEDEVEDELESLGREVEGVETPLKDGNSVLSLPQAPNREITTGDVERQRKSRARERAREQQSAELLAA